MEQCEEGFRKEKKIRSLVMTISLNTCGLQGFMHLMPCSTKVKNPKKWVGKWNLGAGMGSSPDRPQEASDVLRQVTIVPQL